MGSCIGRCVCEAGKCFCCDCVIFGTNLRDTITRRHRRTKPSQTFSLRRQSSSATIEFENLMFEFNLPESSNSIIQMQPTSVSSWLTLKDDSKQKHFAVHNISSRYANRGPNPLSISFNAFNSSVNLITEEKSCELPIIESLVSKSALMRSREDSPDLKDRTSLGGSSSAGELQSLQWENDIIVDPLNAGEHNDTELEWDHFDAHNYAINHETDQLIQEIKELTKSSFSRLP